MILNDNNINKILAALLLFVVLLVYVLFIWLHVPIPGEITVLLGVLTGVVAHALGVKTGQNGGNKP